MSGIRNPSVVVLAPEERRISKKVADAQHRARNSLSLALRQNPVLDPYAFPGDRVRISSDVARIADGAGILKWFRPKEGLQSGR